MASKLAIWTILAGWTTFSGCAALVVGAGAGAGAYTYVNGELARTYEASYSHVMDVCTLILKDLNMPTKSRTSERDQTSIETERHDGTPVTLRIKIIGLNLTEVTVRTGVVGYWNRDSSQQLQDFIAKRIRT
jgi:Protein of unknown function (DUF3568)